MRDSVRLTGRRASPLLGLEQLEARGTFKAMLLASQELGNLVLCLGNQLSGGRRRGSAQVGHKVGDGEVGFMADRGYDGQAARSNGAGHALAVEGGQIFERSAPSGQDDGVDEAAGIQFGQCGFNLCWGLVALHGDGGKAARSNRSGGGSRC